MDEFFALTKGKLAEINKAVEAKRSSMVFFAAPNNRCHIASQIKRPFLYVVSDWVEGKRVYERLCEYSDKNYALMPEREDVLISRQVCNYGALYSRLKILYDMACGKLDGVVVTCEALLQYYPKKELLVGSAFDIEKGGSLNTSTLADTLVTLGYKRCEQVETPATFSLSGDRFEIYPIGSETPYRISLFGDEVESIRKFFIETRLQQEETERIAILPATDFIVPRESVNGILNSINRAKRNTGAELNELVNAEIEKFSANPSSPLNNFCIPFMTDLLDGLYSYLGKEDVLILDDVRLIEDKLRLTRKAFENRVETMYDGKKLLAAHFDSLLTYNDLLNPPVFILGFGRVSSSFSFFKPQEIFNVKTTPLPAFYNDMEGFFTTVKQLIFQGVKIRVYAATEDSKNALTKAFNENDIGIEQQFSPNAEIAMEVGRVTHGFLYTNEKIMCIGINDLSRKTAVRRSLERKRVVFELPEKGDYVVHEKHGIGISEGMQKIQTLSGEKDFYVVMYRDGDKLFLPAEQLNTIEKYNGADKPQLHKLGGAEFERVKNRVRASVKAMAIDLVSVYQARYMKKGVVYQPDTPWQKELEDDFEYTETDDQLVAINEIKHDMESGKIMDRLLCGDVGFGKTEVAIRAIFKTVIEGKQAVVLAPTTILAQQHYNLLCARMNKFKLKIELLSRFVSNEEIKKSLQRIKNGESNIIVATHRILSKDVVFCDLGLLVLDEEQRFGVEHKEKLKAYRNQVNVLSLSATPIPRTLHMALSGIRDISTLETPPKNRLPVETYVTEYSDDLLRDAINKELARGGQVFVLYNRVQGIENFYRHVCSLVSDEVSAVYAHGQMDEERLEDAIKKFYDGEAQILVSTTIIENGIDLPNANTLFVIDADKLGLGQAYQLRGRVGRSDVLAYAYFTVREGKVLTQNAVQRLDALMANTDLGSGFKIAMRDLEIRGAGNVLGREQSGQMEKVGYEMYLRLIKEGIDEAQGKTVKEMKEPELHIDGNYTISECYITDTKARIAVYKTVAVLSSSEEGQEYYKKLQATYGDSGELKNIIRVGILKNFAKKLGITKVVIGENGTGLYYSDSSCLSDEKLFCALEEFKDIAVLSPSNPPVIVFKTKKISQIKRIKYVKDFLEIAIGDE